MERKSLVRVGEMCAVKGSWYLQPLMALLMVLDLKAPAQATTLVDELCWNLITGHAL